MSIFSVFLLFYCYDHTIHLGFVVVWFGSVLVDLLVGYVGVVGVDVYAVLFELVDDLCAWGFSCVGDVFFEG